VAGGVLCSCPVSAVVIYEHCALLGRLFSPHTLLSSPYHDYFSRGQLSPRSAIDELALERLSPFLPRETGMTGPFLKSASRIRTEKWFCKMKCEVYKPLH
jgi:hypothetical protein